MLNRLSCILYYVHICLSTVCVVVSLCGLSLHPTTGGHLEPDVVKIKVHILGLGV
jgi:hypothetical protein